jgi:hypothetical protein
MRISGLQRFPVLALAASTIAIVWCVHAERKPALFSHHGVTTESQVILQWDPTPSNITLTQCFLLWEKARDGRRLNVPCPPSSVEPVLCTDPTRVGCVDWASTTNPKEKLECPYAPIACDHVLEVRNFQVVIGHGFSLKLVLHVFSFKKFTTSFRCQVKPNGRLYQSDT